MVTRLYVPVIMSEPEFSPHEIGILYSLWFNIFRVVGVLGESMFACCPCS